MALEVSRGEIVEGQGPLRQVPFGQGSFKLRLATPEPSHGVIEGTGVRRSYPQGRPQAGQSRVRVPAPGCGQRRLRVEQSGDDHGDDQVALTALLRCNEGF